MRHFSITVDIAASPQRRVTLALEFAGLLGGLFGLWTRNVNGRYLGMEASGLKRRSEMPNTGLQRTVTLGAQE